jgi:hypothetical protein
VSAELEGEVLAEEVVEAGNGQPVRALDRYQDSSPVLRGEVRTAAIAAAGGLIAGAATVAAVRAVSAASGRGQSRGLRRRRQERPVKVLASRSFLVDVHLLDR